jgi:hypothetical protein
MIRCIDSASGLVPIEGTNNGGVVADGAPGEGSVQTPLPIELEWGGIEIIKTTDQCRNRIQALVRTLAATVTWETWLQIDTTDQPTDSDTVTNTLANTSTARSCTRFLHSLQHPILCPLEAHHVLKDLFSLQ